jgi:hypothetical protein
MFNWTENITISATPTTFALTEAAMRTRSYQINGTHTMGGAFTITLATPVNASLCNKVQFYYTAVLSNYDTATNYLKIGPDKLPAEYAQKECYIVCVYSNISNAWKVMFLPDFTQAAIITSSHIVDGTIVAGDLASDSVPTAKIVDGNVTLPKIENIPDDTILGNISGGSASPTALDVEDVRTLLDQDVTLTGHVTGTATQTFATGNTSLSTTISNNTITVAMCTNTVNTDLVTIPISMETGALTAGSCYVAVKVPYACTVEEYGFSVTELIEATDDATITLYNTAGTLMGSSSITVTKNTKPSSSAAGGSFFNSSSITSNNSISTGNIFYVRVQKTTAGGKGFVNIKIKRA